jgi:hypothetical protein
MGNADPNIVAFRDAVQDAGNDLVERWGWQRLKLATPASWTGDGATTLFPLPQNWRTLGPSDTFVSSAYPTLTMPGPTNEEMLLRMKALPVVVAPSCWRQVENQIEFFPALGLNEVVTYVYAQNSWITDQNGTPYPSSSSDMDDPEFVADTDLTVISERVLMLGAIYYWKRRKGFDYADELEDFELCFDRVAGQESTTRQIHMSRTINIVGDTWFPGTITDLQDENY